MTWQGQFPPFGVSSFLLSASTSQRSRTFSQSRRQALGGAGLARICGSAGKRLAETVLVPMPTIGMQKFSILSLPPESRLVGHAGRARYQKEVLLSAGRA